MHTCIYVYIHISYTYMMWLANDTICFTDEPEHGKTLLGALDYAWLFPYAITMFFR